MVPALGQGTTPGTNTVHTATPAAITIPMAPLNKDVPARPLSSDEAVRIAIVHQPTVEAAEQAVLAAKARTDEARAATKPQVAVGLTYNDVESLNTVQGRPSSAIQSIAGYEGTAALKQLLFDFQHTREVVAQTRFLEVAAQDSLLKAREDLALSTRQAYYSYANAVRVQQISEASLANRQKQLDLAQAQLKTGVGLPSDVARAETSVSQGVTSLTASRAEASLARINLALIIGIDPRTPINITQENAPTASSDSLPDLVAAALKSRLDVKLASDTLKSAQHGIRAARTNNSPVVSASLGLGSTGANFVPGNDAFNVGVSLSWDPFDGGLTAGKVREAKANAAIAVAQKKSTELQVASDVAQAYIAMKTAEQRISSAKDALFNAKEGLRIAVGRFSSGLGLFLDITDAETALESAESDVTVATLDVNQARAALSHAIGAKLPGGL